MSDTHTIKCSVCKYSLDTETKLEEHMLAKHYIQCPMCPMKIKDKEAFSTHFKTDHISTCTKCGKEFGTLEELKKHMEQEHSFICTVCSKHFQTNLLLNMHRDEAHKHDCPLCNKIFANTSNLNDHVKDDHTFHCEMCKFEGTTALIMENHILAKHFTPDENNKFCCDECTNKFDTREQLGNHLREEHKDKDKSEQETGSDEEGKLKEELRQLKNNFQRLESLFQDSLEEVNKVKTEYEAKLIEANDKYRTVKAENEELKEKVDVLFKLGRSYINRKEKPDKEEKKETPKTPEETVETVTIEDAIDEDDLQTWTKNKFRGFKRANPTAPSAKNGNSNSEEKKTLPKQGGNQGTSPASENVPSPPTASSTITQPRRSENEGGRILYCHYFSNFGKCLFEEKTGAACRFEHKAAPVCQSGTACKRTKCMYKHPNTDGVSMKNPFLDQNRGFSQHINPWQMMSPWINPNQFMNPWNMEPSRN